MLIRVYSPESLQTALGTLRTLYAKQGYLELRVSDRKRSIDQNALSHIWYEQVVRELQQDTPLGVKSYCKLHFGVPILRAEDEEYRALYDSAIKPMSYEQKLKVMAHWAVTSLMTPGQMSQYLEAMCQHYNGIGVNLRFPDES